MNSKWLIFLWFFLSVSFCSTRPAVETEPQTPQSEAANPGSENPVICQDSKIQDGIPNDREAAGLTGQPNTSVNCYQTGVASWYGADFHGKLTANGEVYDMHKLTAAHPILPFNTLVEVENLDNQKKIMVRINDRGPFIKNRIIDLSFKAATLLGMEESGTAGVNLRIVNPSNMAVGAIYYYLQIGAFRQKENAGGLVDQLKEILPQIPFQVILQDELFKVVSEKLDSPAKALELQKALEAYSIQSLVKESFLP